MTAKRFEALEKQTRILQEVAASFPKESPQYAAIQTAAFALIFAISEQYESFVHYVDSCQEGLSDEQKKHLRTLGIPVD